MVMVRANIVWFYSKKITNFAQLFFPQMNIEELREYCLSFRGTSEGLPFDDRTLVFYVKGKMFCLVDIIDWHNINVKCEPEKAIELRELYSEVIGGVHMNKKHWNTVKIDGNIPDSLIREWIADSYNLVVEKLPKVLRLELQQDEELHSTAFLP